MLLPGSRRWRPIILFLLFLTCLGMLYYFQEPMYKVNDGSAYDAPGEIIADTAALCKKHHLTAAPNHQRRKVYDLFTLNTELDLLEIRLHTLAAHVDYFIIVESSHTFTGHPKPLHLLQNLTTPRFASFAPQIFHHTFHPNLTSPIDPWSLERAQRNSLLIVLQDLPSNHPACPHENDILLVSDIDELPRPSALTLLRQCTFPTPRITLSTTSHLYSFNYIHSLPQKRHWLHPQATVYRKPSELTIQPEDLRTSAAKPDLKAQYRVIGDAGWHCSSCFSTIAEMQAKLRGFSHQEFNQPVFLDPRQIVRRVREGVDLAERKWERFERRRGTVEDWDVPEYLKENRERFPWLIDRDAENGRFEDWKGEGARSLEEWEGVWPEKWPE